MGAEAADESPLLSRFRPEGESTGAPTMRKGMVTQAFYVGAHPVRDEPTER